MDTAPSSSKNTNVATILIINTLISCLVGGFSATGVYWWLNQRTSIPPAVTTLNRNEPNGTRVTINSTDESGPVIDAAKASVDSVVSIVATRSGASGTSIFDRFFGNSSGEASGDVQVSAGTGFVVTNDGHIITNRHVVDDTTANYTVIFNDGTRVSGAVIDRDVVLDIAFVKVDPSKAIIKPIPLGVSENVVVGQTAIAIGNSLGEFSNTTSRGIISGLNRRIQAGDAFGGNTETLENIIQTDASINSGNSGGPLLDITGNVIGVNVAKAQEGENIGFAIPIDMVKPILSSVILKGKIVRPYLGIRYIDITAPIAKDLGLGKDIGALVRSANRSAGVIAGSPAEKAGIREGDILLSIGGQDINLTNSLRVLLIRFESGQTVPVVVYRDGGELTLNVTLAELPR